MTPPDTPQNTPSDAAEATPQDIARRSADALLAGDHATAALGISIESIAPGLAVLSMTVRSDMSNGHGTCHGGFIFALADTAFAFACNSYNQRCVAQHCSITYLAPGRVGSKLTATARERQRLDRNGIYDVSVTDESSAIIAEFRGNSRTVPGSMF
jgi:acyl-CoA thioesterase